LDAFTGGIFMLHNNLLVKLCTSNFNYSVAFQFDATGVWDILDIGVFVFFSMDLVFSKFLKFDLLLDFMMEYRDEETFLPVRDHKRIAKKYIYSGWFFVDFASTFPVSMVMPSASSVLWVRLFRLFRLPKLIKILDLSRFNRLLRSLFENSTRQDRIVSQYILMYTYKIFRLVIMAVIIIYFVGCIWYLVSQMVNTTNEDKAASFV